MFRSCYYDNKRSTMHLWETVSGERSHSEYSWVPYIYVDDIKGSIQTINKKPVRKKQFNSYYDYRNFCRYNRNIYENKTKPEIQFLAERYYKIPDEELEVPELLIYSIDIEVNSDEGFPSAHLAEWPITVISIKNSVTDEVITFGEQEYTGDMDINFTKYDSEEKLLNAFFSFMHRNPCDVISGWNVMDFDLAYLINRSKRLFGKNTNVYTFLSPIRVVRTWLSKKTGDLNIDIAGVHILDYWQVYKWYTPNNLQNYKLDFVSNFELGTGKVDYSEFEDLRELYAKNWNKYVDYNVTDVIRVNDLENKLGYIRLIQTLSLLTKCPMKFYNTMTHLVEGALLTYFRRKDLCAPFFAGGEQEPFIAAWVKPPHTGMHEWVIDIDIKSSYPSHIIALNISTETFVGRIQNINEEKIVYYTRHRNFPEFVLRNKRGENVVFSGDKLESFNKALKRGLFSISPCGTMFTTKDIGILPALERQVFVKRQEIKDKMNDYIAKGMDDKAKEAFSLQWAMKIFLNAVFGITAVPYSRYFNVDISEAITSCGRHTIKQGEFFVNELFKEKGFVDDFVAYIDTDSLFVKLGDYFNRTYKNEWLDLNDAEKIEYINVFSKELVDYVNERTYKETQLLDYNSQVNDFKVLFEQEIIAKTALFVKKKMYTYWMVNKDGFEVDVLHVKGLEIVRSNCPEAIKKRLQSVMTMILKRESDQKIQDAIIKHRSELKNVLPEEISANITVNNPRKYLDENNDSIKGTPWHVKGTGNYRKLLHDLDIADDYEDVYEGSKAKVVYVKKNVYNMDVITFIRWPKEFDQYFIIDYDKMIDKFFTKKLSFLLDPMEKLKLLSDINDKALNIFF